MATNAFAAFVQGRQAGQQARAFEQQQQDRNALRTLAPQILAGDPAAFDQAAAINPEAAVAYQDAGDAQLRRLKGALDYFDQGIKSGDDRLIQARFKEISPFMSRITGKEAPPAWTADMMPAFEQAKTRVAMLTDPKGQSAGRVIGNALVDGSGKVLYQGPDTPVNAQIINVPDGQGGTVQMIFDPRTRELSMPQYPGAPAPSQPATQPPPSAPSGAGQDLYAGLHAAVPGLRVTSGQRTPEQNRRVGGVENSYHLTGEAIDIGTPSPEQRQAITQWAGANGFEVIDNYGDGHIHLEPAPGRGRASGAPASRLGYTPPKADSGRAPPSGYRWTASGALEPIPGGPADPAAQTQSSGNPTEGERKAATLLARLEGSLSQMNRAIADDSSAASPSVAAAVARGLPFVGEVAGNALNSAERQRVEAAQLDILDAALTLGTGAAYTKEQLEGYRRSYFPQLGDSEATIRDKQQRLDNVIDAARIAAGRAAPKTATTPAYSATDDDEALIGKYL